MFKRKKEMTNDDKLKKEKRFKKINIITNILIFISMLILTGLIIYIDFLPNKYLYPLIIGIVFINLLLIFISIFKKFNRKIKKINLVIKIIVILVELLSSFYIFKTRSFLDNLDIDYKTINFKVVVLDESSYEDITDLDNQSMGYYSNSDVLDESLEEINNTVSVSLEEYSDLNELRDDLLNSEIESILIEESYYNIMTDVTYETGEETSDSDEESVFESSTRVIYEFSINMETGEITKSVDDVTSEAFNIYVSGLDTYGTIASVSRSDVNMVITVNPTTHQILLTSIPRDYYVQLHGTTGLKDKLTHAGIYGVDMSVSTIEDLLDIDINYYVKVNFSSVINIVDSLGGVEVYSEYTFTSKDKYHYTKGYNAVNGKQALSFARERKAFSSGDRQRIKNQQALFDAIFRKCISPSILIKYTSLLDALSDSFVTNMSTNEITSLIKMQLNDEASWTITSNSLEGSDSKAYTYSAPSQLLYVMEPDEESVTYAGDLIRSVLSGEVLEASYDTTSSDVHSVTSVSGSSTSSSSSSSSSSSNSSTTSKKSSSSNSSSSNNTTTGGSDGGDDDDTTSDSTSTTDEDTQTSEDTSGGSSSEENNGSSSSTDTGTSESTEETTDDTPSNNEE